MCRFKKMLVLFLAISWTAISGAYSQDIQKEELLDRSSVSAPITTVSTNNDSVKTLTENEKRQLIELLLKYEVLTSAQSAQIKTCIDTVNGLNKLFDRGIDNYELSIKNAEEKTKLSETRVALERERGDLYEKLFKEVTRGKGIWCGIKRFFTLGLARCL
jgi:hypothetical protein